MATLDIHANIHHALTSHEHEHLMTGADESSEGLCLHQQDGGFGSSPTSLASAEKQAEHTGEQQHQRSDCLLTQGQRSRAWSEATVESAKSPAHTRTRTHARMHTLIMMMTGKSRRSRWAWPRQPLASVSGLDVGLKSCWPRVHHSPGGGVQDSHHPPVHLYICPSIHPSILLWCPVFLFSFI